MDTSNQINFLANSNNWLNSNGVTTNIRSDVYMGDSTAITRRLKLDCVAHMKDNFKLNASRFQSRINFALFVFLFIIDLY